MYINLDILKTRSGSFIILNKEGGHEKLAEEIFSSIFDSFKNNPDILNIDLGKIEKLSIGVADIKENIHTFYYKPYQNNHKVFSIYQAEKLTVEAQNALLKLIEEPPINSYVFLFVNSINPLLKTVLSRCELVNIKSKDIVENIKESSNFLEMNIDEQYEVIKKLYTIKDPKERREEVNNFFNMLIKVTNSSALGKERKYRMLEDIIDLHEKFKSEVNLRLVLENLIITLNTN